MTIGKNLTMPSGELSAQMEQNRGNQGATARGVFEGAALLDERPLPLEKYGNMRQDHQSAMLHGKYWMDASYDHVVLCVPLKTVVPVRKLQDAAEMNVPAEMAQRILYHAEGPDIPLELVKKIKHRVSAPDCLDAIARPVEQILLHA